MVVLSGGEPLTNPNLEALIERIRTDGMAISIDSNGVLIDREAAQSLKRAGVMSIELSLDGVDEQSHDHFRGLGGAFKKTLDAVEECSKAGIFTTVATTATKLNHSKSGELVSLARSRGADRVVFFDLIPAGRGREVRNLHLSKDELTELMSLVRGKSSPDGEVFTELPQFVVYSAFADGKSTSDQSNVALSVDRFTISSFFDCAGRGNIYRKLAPYLGGCPAGRLYCNIQPNGDVTPCMFMPHYPVAGNLKEQPFQEIWEQSEVFRALRTRSSLKGKCRECKNVIICGGCRAKAAAYLGDYLASDPTCPIQSENSKPGIGNT
jgi:radical SAM protein with 4Fe4S-binding SPASM domain